MQGRKAKVNWITSSNTNARHYGWVCYIIWYQKTAITILNNINRLVCVLGMQCLLWGTDLTCISFRKSVGIKATGDLCSKNCTLPYLIWALLIQRESRETVFWDTKCKCQKYIKDYWQCSRTWTSSCSLDVGQGFPFFSMVQERQQVNTAMRPYSQFT